MQPDPQAALQITSSTVTGAEPDKTKLPLSYEWTEINKTSPFYTIQDQAFPKQQADQYFSVQSDVLQGKMSPADAAKQMQDRRVRHGQAVGAVATATAVRRRRTARAPARRRRRRGTAG